MSKPSTPKPSTPKPSPSVGLGGPSPVFTPRMQDAQARNKDPYGSSSSDSTSGRFDAYGNDSYEAVTARREAAIVLDSPELLMMHAAGRNDSITATRRYFTKQMCGYVEPESGKEKKR